MSYITKIFGSRNGRYIKSVQPLVEQTNGYEPHCQQMDDAELKEATEALKARYHDGETLENLLPEAFAMVREAAFRTLGLRAFDVQLVGGIILHQGRIAEMKTGEGKTLVAVFAAYLNALTGKGVHCVTVNDYLAQRDAEWMGQVYEALGMSCGFVLGQMDQETRREAYSADVTYATNNELGFDYLRDNMAFTLEQRVQRDMHYAIVDEVDSILIDESRTPLIISGPAEDKRELYKMMDTIIPKFAKADDYEVDEKLKQVALTDKGMDKAESLLRAKGMIKADESLYEIDQMLIVHHLNQALRAHTLFHKDVDYMVNNNQVMLIDEFTGRMMEGRRLSEGLHQALEAKEGVDVQNENQTLASITFQNYFRMYEKIAGMTGTADTEAEEFESIYGLGVISVPTNVDVARLDEADKIYRTKEEKHRAILKDIRECFERGQPVLVGTTSIEKSEDLAEMLKKHKIDHQVLNARYHDKEAEIIAQAGRLGAVTVATNMAGRGTDIKLGGNLDLLLEGAKDKAAEKFITSAYEREKEDVISLGGLRVVSTERHESRRIDNQLRGRSGRQGDPGSSVFYISLQDDLMRIFAKGLDVWMERIDMPDDEVIQSKIVTKAIETAQRKLEGRNFDFRKQTLKYDDVLNEQRKVIYEERLGVMGSETVDDIINDFRAETSELLFQATFPIGSTAELWNITLYKRDMARLFSVYPEVDKWLEDDGISPEDIQSRSRALVENIWLEKNNRLTAPVMRRLEKALMLQVLDHEWKEHLQRLDFLRQGIHLRSYGQKDPLNEFKREAFVMFEHLLVSIQEQTVALLSHVEVDEDSREAFLAEVGQVEEVHADELENDSLAGLVKEDKAPEERNPYADQRIGRNEPCPCGSGKKYKQCHGKLA